MDKKKLFNMVGGGLIILIATLTGFTVGYNMKHATQYIYTSNHRSFFKALDDNGIEYTPTQKDAICKQVKEEKK